MNTRRADIQGLRAVAVLLVVAYHGGFHVPGGFTGVDVFFAISGFVITRMLLGELSDRGRIDLPRFYARRIKRLLPALAAMVAVVGLLAILANQFGAQLIAAKTGIAAAFFAANAYLYHLPTGYFDVSTSADPFLHTWTLAVEEQFYVIFPTLLFVAWKVGRRSAVAAVALVTALSFALSVAVSYGHSLPGISTPEAFAFYGSPTRAWEFGLGALLALIAPRLPRFAAEVCAAGGVAAIAVAAFGLHGTTHFPGLAALLPVGGAVLVLAGGGSLVSRGLALRPAVWIGDLSYSWYLWHWPLIVEAHALWPGSSWAPRVAALLSLGPAWASYRWIENPIRFDPSIVGRRVVGLAAACIALPIVACVALAAGHHALARTTAMESWQISQEAHADLVRGCDAGAPLPHAKCTWRVAGERGTIALVGDSNAGQFTEPVVAAGNRAGFDVQVATYSGCPFIALRVDRADLAREDACLSFDEALTAKLVRERPRIVVIGNRSDGYINGSADGLARIDSGSLTFDEHKKAALWTAGLAAAVAQLRAAGVHVLVVRPVPVVSGAPLDCAVLRILVSACTRSLSRSRVDQELALATVAERKAVRGPGAEILSLVGDLCTADRCSTTKGSLYLYRDDDHLSVAGALSLTGRFQQAIHRLAK